MADVKISGLPAAASALVGDQHPVNQGGVTKRETNQQIYDLIASLLNTANPLTLGGGSVSIGSDGNISFATGAIQLLSDGTVIFGATPFSQVTINNAGGITIDGNASAASLQIGTPASAQINNDGTAFFLGVSQVLRFDYANGFVIDLGDLAGNNFQITLEGNVIGADGLWNISSIGAADFGSVKVGGGAPMLKVLSATDVLDFPNTNSQLSSDLTIALAGAAVGDTVMLGVPNGSVNANTCFTAWVSSANTVTVRFNNYSAAAVNPASGTFRVTIIQF